MMGVQKPRDDPKWMKAARKRNDKADAAQAAMPRESPDAAKDRQMVESYRRSGPPAQFAYHPPAQMSEREKDDNMVAGYRRS